LATIEAAGRSPSKVDLDAARVAVDPHVEEDRPAGDGSEHERRPLGDVDGDHPEPEIEKEEEGPEERNNAFVDARRPEVHRAMLTPTCHTSAELPQPHASWSVRSHRGEPFVAESAKHFRRVRGPWPRTFSDQSFAEPVALSSTGPADFRLPPTIAGTDFVLVALRARRKWHPRGLAQPLARLDQTPSPLFAKSSFFHISHTLLGSLWSGLWKPFPPMAGASGGGGHTRVRA
jgi:hypothetical protein